MKKLFRIYAALISLLDARERRHFWTIIILFIAMGFAEAVGIASIFPFLTVLARPEIVERQPQLVWLRDLTGLNNQRDFLIFLALATFFIMLAAQAVKAGATYAASRFSNMRVASLSSRLFSFYLRQHYDWFLGRNSAELSKSMISEVEVLVARALLPALQLVAHSILLFVIFFLLVVFDPTVAIGVIVMLGGSYAMLYALVRRRLESMGTHRATANTIRYGVAQEALSGIKNVKLLALEETYQVQFRSAAEKLGRMQAHYDIISQIPRYLLEALGYGALLALVVILLSRGDGSLPSIIPILGLYALAAVKALPALQMVYQSISSVLFSQEAVQIVRKEFELRGSAQNDNAGKNRQVGLKVERHIDFVGVSYDYPGARRSGVHNLNLRIDAHATIGIVGTTGAGKTTIVDILLGLLTPCNGEVLVDGELITLDNKRAFQQTLGYVPQDIYLTDQSISSNIAFGVPTADIDMDKVERAAKSAELHAFVTTELPDGYGTIVGERGVRLSGGQRQRIGIARALYRDPSVLVLDEATSALDSVTERAVMDAMSNLGREKTIIIVTHRLSTVEACDMIYVVKNGTVVDSGTYNQLREVSKVFREILQTAP